MQAARLCCTCTATAIISTCHSSDTMQSSWAACIQDKPRWLWELFYKLLTILDDVYGKERRLHKGVMDWFRQATSVLKIPVRVVGSLPNGILTDIAVVGVRSQSSITTRMAPAVLV